MLKIKTQTHLLSELTFAIEGCSKSRTERIFSYSFRFEANDLLPLLTHQSDRKTSRIYWEQPYSGFSIAGLGSILTLDYKVDEHSTLNSHIIDQISNAVSISDNKLIGPKFLGGHAFNPDATPDNTWKGFPRGRFILPECLATKTDDGTWLTISRIIKITDNPENVLKEFLHTCTHYSKRLPVTLPPIIYVSVDKFRDVPDKATYNESIYSVLEAIKPNVLDKVVISRSHHVKVGQEFSAVSAIQILRNMYPKCTSFFFSFPKEGIFFGSTPERLIRKRGGKIETEALAGTIARGRNMEEDRLLAETLFGSHKEREEHRFVIDQITRRLQPIVDELQLPHEPDILRLKNVQHLQTSISGELTNGENILDLVKRLHPTPAVAGTPTESAMKVIQNHEKHDRGWYSGPIGWVDESGEGDFVVALRSALVKDEEAHVFAGGGIVSESLPDQEWEETELKLQPIISALSGGQQ